MSCNRTLPALVLFGVLAALPMRSAHADWKRDYDLGVRAAESGQWAEAETLMRSALASESRPDARKRFQGTVVKAYVPHYFAGLAAYRQGRCEVALQYWRNGDNAAVVAGLSEFNTVQSRGITDCTQKLAAAKPGPAPVQGPTQAVARVDTRTPPVATRTTPETPVPNPRGASPQKKPEPARTAPQQVAVVKTPKPAAIQAPGALATAVEDYLAGRYQKVIQFDPASVTDGRSRAQGYLLRAAARFTQANLDDAGVQALAVVRQDVRAARAANANLSPDEVVFSPRFRELWKQTR